MQRASLQPWGPEAEEQALGQVLPTQLLGERETRVRGLMTQQRVRLLCVEAAFLVVVVLQLPRYVERRGRGEGGQVSAVTREDERNPRNVASQPGALAIWAAVVTATCGAGLRGVVLLVNAGELWLILGCEGGKYVSRGLVRWQAI